MSLLAVHRSHPHADQLERFMRGELSPAEVRPVVRHMVSGCKECLKVTRPIWVLMEEKLKRPKGSCRWRKVTRDRRLSKI